MDLEQKLRRLWYSINGRCNTPSHSSFNIYGGKGVRNLLSIEDLRTLWERDHADLLSKPSIDRKEASGHYSFDNCRFIEHALNAKGGTRFGIDNSRAKLTEHQVQTIMELRGVSSRQEIAQQFKIAKSTVSGIHNGRSWAWLNPTRKSSRSENG
jgi:hypothetical protein